MTISTIIITAFALAMDAFAVSFAIGLSDKQCIKSNALKCGVAFGSFQAFMTTIGWLLGIAFYVYIKPIDHFIAFILLCFIGIKMIVESFDQESEKCLSSFKMLITLAIATSIDAMAAGLSFSSINPELTLLTTSMIIGIVSFVLSYLGVYLGNIMRNVKKLGKYADLFGGVVLIAIGIKVLIEHLINGI